jgi:hypothetical protein
MRKNAQLSVRITEDEMAGLRKQADKESVLLSQLVRAILAAGNRRMDMTGLFGRFTTSTPITRPGRALPGA